jgi:hypothetical protein
MKITLKPVYGIVRAYPADPTAQRFADLLKVKTLTRWHLEQIEALGFTIEADGGLQLSDVA